MSRNLQWRKGILSKANQYGDPDGLDPPPPPHTHTFKSFWSLSAMCVSGLDYTCIKFCSALSPYHHLPFSHGMNKVSIYLYPSLTWAIKTWMLKCGPHNKWLPSGNTAMPGSNHSHSLQQTCVKPSLHPLRGCSQVVILCILQYSLGTVTPTIINISCVIGQLMIGNWRQTVEDFHGKLSLAILEFIFFKYMKNDVVHVQLHC